MYIKGYGENVRINNHPRNINNDSNTLSACIYLLSQNDEKC